MKPTPPLSSWRRLVATARRNRDDRSDAAPYGFATRVTAIAFASTQHRRSLVDRFAVKAVGIACLLALASAVVNYGFTSSAKTSTTPPSASEQANTEDAMSALLDA